MLLCSFLVLNTWLLAVLQTVASVALVLVFLLAFVAEIMRNMLEDDDVPSHVVGQLP